MKENWIQLIDTIEKDPFETEAFFALMDYVGEASDDDKRRVVQEVERRIKMIARYDVDKSFRFRKFSEQEREALDSLWSTRVKILNVMMLNPTEKKSSVWDIRTINFMNCRRMPLRKVATYGSLCCTHRA